MSTNAIIALSIATLIPLATMFFIRSRDVYKEGSYWNVIWPFLWGALVYAAVAQLNGWLLSTERIEYLTLVQFVAPIEEEILKAAIFLYLIRKINMTYFVDFAIYGFTIGIGFAVFENYEYILNGNVEYQLAIAIGRVISTNLIHAAGTAIVGISFGLARFHKLFKLIGTILLGLAAALAIHITFNNLVTRDWVSPSFLLIYAAAVGISVTIIIFIAIKRGLKSARGWIEEKLGAADRVTSSETKLVTNIEDLKALLEPLTEMFGEDVGPQVHEFILIQARLGIHRKNLDKFEDQSMIDQTKEEIEKLQPEMDEMRRELGPYVMMSVRNIFPPDENQLWGDLEDTIANRIEAAPTAPGGGLWGALESATKASDEDNG